MFLRTLLIGILCFILGIIAFFIGWLITGQWKLGLIATLVVFSIGAIGCCISFMCFKKLGWSDVFLPLIFSVFWSILMFPLKVATDLFAAPYFIIAGIMLTACLWLYKNERIGKGFLVAPIICYCYEMLPITIPGPIDNFLSIAGGVGGTVIAVVAACIKSDERQILKENNVNAIDIEVIGKTANNYNNKTLGQ